MKFLRVFCQIILGLHLVMTGLPKLADPVGTSLLIQEYLGMIHGSWLNPAADFMAMCYGLVETLLGIAVLSGLRYRLTALAAVIFTSLTTLLTLVLVIRGSGTVSSLIAHFSFILMAICMLSQHRKVEPMAAAPVEWTLLGVYAAVLLVFSISAYNSLPRIDYTPFKAGTDFQRANDGEGRVSLVFQADSTEGRAVADEGPLVVSVVWNPLKMDAAGWQEIMLLRERVDRIGVPFRLFATHEGVPEELSDALLTGQESDLRALMRSNGGGVYFYDGGIICKWAAGKMLDGRLEETLGRDPDEALVEFMAAEKTYARVFVAILLISILLMRYICRFNSRKNARSAA